jgi:DMSO reductase anchor subunit
MHPAFSVVFLTTLIGAGQGLFLALYSVDVAARHDLVARVGDTRFFVAGAFLAAVLGVLGLVASLFHLGHPERGWRAAAQWRTSWLSREVIALPAFIVGVCLYGVAYRLGSNAVLPLGILTLVACLALFACTSMIYACIRFLQEWASPLTLINFFLLGSASGFTLATALAGALAPEQRTFYATAAIALTALALVFRAASLRRNARLKPNSSLQTAIGIRHPRIAQKSQGFTGGSFNTREFFHGVAPTALRAVKWMFVLFTFVLPVALLALGLATESATWFAAAFAVQYVGLLAERWFFLAQANHPQNLYYQCIS